MKISYIPGLIVACYILYQGVIEIDQSAIASTAAANFVLLPFIVLFYGICAFVLSWALLSTGFFIVSLFKSSLKPQINGFYTTLSVLFIMAFTYTMVNAEHHRQHTQYLKAVSDPQKLHQLHSDAWEKNDTESLLILVWNPHLTPDLIREVNINLPKSDTDFTKGMAVGLAQHTNTPSDVLAELAQIDSSQIRHSVAGNPHTSAAILVQLSEESDDRVKWAIIFNKNTPLKVLQTLSKDPDDNIARAAQRQSDAKKSP